MCDIVETIQAEQDASSGPAWPASWSCGRAGHRQDRGGAAPGRLPALHLPPPAREARRAGDRPERHVPALHRPGAAVPGRDQRAAVDRRRPVPGRQRDRLRAGRRPPRSRAGRGHGQGGGGRGARPPAGARASRVEIIVDHEKLSADPQGHQPGPRARPAVAAAAQPGPGGVRPRDHHRADLAGRGPARPQRARRAQPAGRGGDRRPARRAARRSGRCRRPSSGCGPCSRRSSCSPTCSPRAAAGHRPRPA